LQALSVQLSLSIRERQKTIQKYNVGIAEVKQRIELCSLANSGTGDKINEIILLKQQVVELKATFLKRNLNDHAEMVKSLAERGSVSGFLERSRDSIRTNIGVFINDDSHCIVDFINEDAGLGIFRRKTVHEFKEEEGGR
jgi:hypothetical protein